MALETLKSAFSIVGPAPVDESEWPLPAYIEAWKAFRRVSNEADGIAGHLIRQRWEPSRKPVNVLDVGTGDGVLLEKILLLCKTCVRNVYAVDPNPVFLAEARSHLAHVGISGELQLIKAKIEEVPHNTIRESDVVIFAHVVYFAGTQALLGTLRQLRSGSCCYVVFDAEDSIFSRLWEKTALPEYLTRVRETRRMIDELSDKDWHVHKTTITTQVRSPNELRPKIRDQVKSLLCYSEVTDMDHETLAWVDREIQSAESFGQLHCTSDCYEIIRR